jgi:hypothetical protein
MNEAAPADDFDTAFAAFMSEELPAAAQEAPAKAEEAPAGSEETPAKAEEAPAGSEETPAKAEEAPAEAEEAPVADEKPPAEAQKAPAGTSTEIDALSDEELLARFAALVRKAEPAPVATQPAAQQPPAPAPDIYTPEERQLLESYYKDWPDVARAEQLARRAEYRQLVGYVFEEIAKHLRPLSETVEVLSTRAHLADLQSRIADYDQVRDRVIEWVAKQPAYLQAAYNRVIEQGTVEEVADLIERFKRESGATAQNNMGQTQPRQRTPELPPATKKAAAALAPVGSKRAPVSPTLDLNNFEEAFARFAANP